MLLFIQSEKIGDPILGIIIPGSILLLSVIVTWALYKHFSQQSNEDQVDGD
jgi:hypothetical protein